MATEVIVHVRADGCSLHDGTPLADSAVASLLEYDHPTPYRITPRTHTDEMARRCPTCHDRKTKADRGG